MQLAGISCDTSRTFVSWELSQEWESYGNHPLPTIDSMGGANTHSSIKTAFKLWWWWWYYEIMLSNDSKLLKVCHEHFALYVSWKCNKFLRFKKYIQKKSSQQELKDRRRWDKLLEFHKWIKLEPFIFYINQDVIFRPRIPISSRTALKLDLLSQLLFL